MFISFSTLIFSLYVGFQGQNPVALVVQVLPRCRRPVTQINDNVSSRGAQSLKALIFLINASKTGSYIFRQIYLQDEVRLPDLREESLAQGCSLRSPLPPVDLMCRPPSSPTSLSMWGQRRPRHSWTDTSLRKSSAFQGAKGQ